MNKNIKRIPVARCPNAECQRTLLYSDDPKDKLRITTRVAEEGYKGKSMFCSRCKRICGNTYSDRRKLCLKKH